jgi:phosphatidylinositol alpha 1,6-mannosyltransferase
VALFTDAFHEVDGVSNTCRHLKQFALQRNLPILFVNAGQKTRHWREGAVETLELKRGALAFKLDQELGFDIALWRYRNLVRERVAAFRPDVVHVTGPGDFGQMGLFAAKNLHLPLVISWHTNLHEFAAQRLDKLVRFFPARKSLTDLAERGSLAALVRFHKEADLLFAPNEELRAMLETATGVETRIMSRGVETDKFSPAKRDVHDGVFRLGFVGRLRPEKNVRFLAEVERALTNERALEDETQTNFRFLIVGDGSEREWLAANMQRAELTGVLKGDALARAYANMDAFLFPSRTDTFGNVVLEAQASGVPAVVTDGGGPKFIVRHNETGFITRSDDEFIRAARDLISNRELHARMRATARRLACASSWESVFEKVYEGYERVGNRNS